MRSDGLYGILDKSLGGCPSKEWLEIFEREDIPCGPINTPDDLLRDPHLDAVGFFAPSFDTATPVQRTLRQPVLYRGVTREADRMAPALGADTLSLLEHLGYTREEMALLRSAGAVTGPGSEL